MTIIALALSFYSCSKKKDAGNEKVKIDYENPDVVLLQAQNALGPNVKFAYKGKFDTDTVIEIAAGVEIQTKKDWGIKFVLLKMSGDKLINVYETPLENGSFKECLIKKIDFPSLNFEMIYYNSQDYFLGSGGGEVYSYVVNFNESKIYYAHLIAGPGQSMSLYLSDNIDVPEIKAFFLNNFRRDYPGFKIVTKDIVLNY